MLKSPRVNPNPNPLERDGGRRLPASFEIAATSTDSKAVGLSSQEQFMYKNRLQEFTQKSGTALPMYDTVKIGNTRVPQFRSTVLVEGLKFASPRTFSNRKAAEQHIAKLALENISRKIEDEGFSLIQEDTIFCKSALHEFAVKICPEKLTYTTDRAEGVLPVFTSSIIFNGQTYIGKLARSKKEAEQMAARAVIESILAHSDKRALMCEIIRSKRKLYAAFGATSSSSSLSSEGALLRSQNNPINAANREKVLPNFTSVKLHESRCPGNGQHAEAVTTGMLTSEAKILKEGYASEESFGYEGSSHPPQTLLQGGSLASMASNTANTFGESLPHDRINNGVKKIGQFATPEGSPPVVLTSGRKRPDVRRDEESGSKKSRIA